jgi:malate dehydrogenase
MRDVAIVGAGELGGALAHLLARRDLARAIMLIDERDRVAAGKALDISQAAPVERFSTRLAGATDVSAAIGADLMVIADRSGGEEWQGDAGWMLLRQLAKRPGPLILCAGATHSDLIDRGVRDLQLDRRCLFGTAPEALAGAARALVAVAVNGSPRDVCLSVLGRPPAHTVIPWAEATVAGVALTRLLHEPDRRRLETRIAGLWPPGPYSLAAAAAKAVAAIAGRSRQLSSCFVAPETAGGVRMRTAALPVRIGPRGIVEVVLPSLSVGEKVAFDNATQV